MNTRSVAGLLGRDMQTIRRFAKTGRLKCNMTVYNRAVYKLEDVVEFLLANPALCVCKREMLELTAEADELIRRIGYNNWRPLLDACGADDVFQEVRMKFMQTRKTYNSENAIGAVIQRLFADIYRKYKRSIDTKLFDENRKINNSESNADNDIEDSRATGNIDEDEQAIRAEAAQMIMKLPIDYVRAFIKHCPKNI